MRFLIVYFLFMVCSPVLSQNSLGLNLKAYKPHGEFNQNITHSPVGLSFLFLQQINDSQLAWGSELGVAMYNSDRYRYELIEEGYPGEFIKVAEEDCFWTLHILGQYNLISTPVVKSYLELRMGITTFFSERTAVDEYEKRFKRHFKSHGTAFNTGLGTGIMLNPKGIFSENKGPGKLWINLGAIIHSGSVATYRNVEDQNEIFSLGVGKYRSLTYYTDFRLGLLVDL